MISILGGGEETGFEYLQTKLSKYKKLTGTEIKNIIIGTWIENSGASLDETTYFKNGSYMAPILNDRDTYYWKIEEDVLQIRAKDGPERLGDYYIYDTEKGIYIMKDIDSNMINLLYRPEIKINSTLNLYKPKDKSER